MSVFFTSIWRCLGTLAWHCILVSKSPNLKPTKPSIDVRIWRCAGINIMTLRQWFPNLSWRPPNTARFLCLPNQTHLIQLISSINPCDNELMSWIRCVWLGRQRKRAVLGGLQDRFGNHWTRVLYLKKSTSFAFSSGRSCVSSKWISHIFPIQKYF